MRHYLTLAVLLAPVVACAADTYTGTLYAESQVRPDIWQWDYVAGNRPVVEGPEDPGVPNTLIYPGLQIGTPNALVDGAGGPGIVGAVGYDFARHITVAMVWEDVPRWPNDTANWTPTRLSRIRSFCSNRDKDLRVFQNFSIQWKDSAGVWHNLFEAPDNFFGVMKTGDYFVFNSGQWDRSMIEVVADDGGLLFGGAVVHGLKLDHWVLGWWDAQYRPTLNQESDPNRQAWLNRSVYDEMDVFGVPGDVNRDGTVNLDDFLLLAATYETPFGSPGYDGFADFNLDKQVNLDDFLMLAANYEG